MKLLTQIKIDGTPIPVPDSVRHTIVNPGLFGENILQRIVIVTLIAGCTFALITIIIAGIQWTSSEGDKEKLSKARSKLTYSIIGLLVMFFAFFVINIIGGLFGVSLMKQ